MNKKLTNVLRTNVTLYFICLVLFALAAIPFDVRLAIGEGAAAVLLLIIARRRSRSVQQSMRQYMDSGHPIHYGHDLLDGRYRFRAAAPDPADDPACGGHPDGGQL